MSPEQARDQGITGQSDLFSLGVVLYELLAGRPPFNAGTVPGLLHKILHEDPPALSSLRQGLPAGLLAVVHRAMQKERARRYQSGAEMAQDLEAVLAEIQHPVETLSPEQRLEICRSLPFFVGFAESDVQEVVEAGTWRQAPAGEVLVQEGGDDHSFFVIVSGEAVVSKAGKEIGRLPAGECFGEMGYLSQGRRTATVVALTPMVVLQVASAVTEWASLPCQLRLARAFQRTLIERLAETSAHLADHLR
jgi:CRP-like cAMP-binding protein